jgi:hypothetical protein
MEKAIGEKVQGPDLVRMGRPTQRQASHVLRAATRSSRSPEERADSFRVFRSSKAGSSPSSCT